MRARWQIKCEPEHRHPAALFGGNQHRLFAKPGAGRVAAIFGHAQIDQRDTAGNVFRFGQGARN